MNYDSTKAHRCGSERLILKSGDTKPLLGGIKVLMLVGRSGLSSHILKKQKNDHQHSQVSTLSQTVYGF